jgi:hypothetical protein
MKEEKDAVTADTGDKDEEEATAKDAATADTADKDEKEEASHPNQSK